MKTSLWLALTMTLFWSHAEAQVPLLLRRTEPAIIETGPHHRVWQRESMMGHTNVNSYTELATGLAHWNPATSRYEESKEQFVITPRGYAVATNGQHQVIISPTLNDGDGAVDLQTPDGKRLRSTILGLNLFDRLRAHAKITS